MKKITRKDYKGKNGEKQQEINLYLKITFENNNNI